MSMRRRDANTSGGIAIVSMATCLENTRQAEKRAGLQPWLRSVLYALRPSHTVDDSLYQIDWYREDHGLVLLRADL